MAFASRQLDRSVSGIKGFSLVELLVTISCLSILMGILIPAVQMIRETSRQSACGSNLRQIGLSFANFEAAHGRYPPGQLGPPWIQEPPWTTIDFDAFPLLGHLGFVLPYIEEANFQSSLGDLDWRVGATGAAWHLDPTAWQASSRRIPVLRCPSDFGEHPRWVYIAHVPDGTSYESQRIDVTGQNYEGWTNYLGCSGDVLIGGEPFSHLGILYSQSKTRAAEVTDGLTHTILVGELIGGTANVDLERLGAALKRQSILSNGIGNQWGYFCDAWGENQDTSIFVYSSRHAGRFAQFVYADGHIRKIVENVSWDLLAAEMTRSGRDVPEAID